MTEDASGAPKKARADDLLSAWSDSPARGILSDLAALDRSARALTANAHELVRAVEWFEDALVHPLLLPQNRHEMWRFASELIRVFQNAITSGQSFLEHCRTQVSRRYKSHPFAQEFRLAYQQRIESSPVCMFAKELRGFVLHSQSMQPTFMRQLTDFSDPLETTHGIRLSTRALEQERPRWSRATGKFAGEYLDGIGGSLNMRRFIYEYMSVLKEFGDWLLVRQRELNAQMLSADAALYDEMIAFQSESIAQELEGIRKVSVGDSWFEWPPAGGLGAERRGHESTGK